jgi:hypothetical protein
MMTTAQPPAVVGTQGLQYEQGRPGPAWLNLPHAASTLAPPLELDFTHPILRAAATEKDGAP